MSSDRLALASRWPGLRFMRRRGRTAPALHDDGASMTIALVGALLIG
jgi:hypothetical protein